MTYVAASYGPQYPYPTQPYGAQQGYSYAAAPASYGMDAYQRGYQNGAQWASPYAQQTASAGNGLSGIAGTLSGVVNGIVGSVGDLLGSVTNAFSGLTGGSASYGYAQQYPQAAAYQYRQPAGAQAYLQGLPPPPPGGDVWGAYRAVYTDLQRYQVRTPQQGLEKIAMDSRSALEYRRQAERLLSGAERDMRNAVRKAEQAVRTGDPAKMAEARGLQQQAFSSWRQASELSLAVYNSMASATITYNLLFGPYGSWRGADGGQAMRFVQSAQMQYVGGREPGWFSPTIRPPSQQALETQQLIMQGSERILQLQHGAGVR